MEGMERGVGGTPHVAPPPPPTPPPAAAAGTSQSQAPPTLNTNTTNKKKQVKKKSAPNKELKWEEYLEATQSQRAAAHCFKQHEVHPANEFEIGMKLEAIDPRNIRATCIATVVVTYGPWIRLQLDGSDNTNDFWILNDSTEIQPLGTCERNEGFLQPPLTFSRDLGAWQKFLYKTLDGASMAPETCFKAEPPTPPVNLFKVGDKLEAVDRKTQLICVATVGEVNGDNIKVTFDGWGSDIDYWCKYDSRDIFPVGWCQQVNYPLEPPGSKPRLVRNQAVGSSSTSTARGHQSHGTDKAKTKSGKKKPVPRKMTPTSTQREVVMQVGEVVDDHRRVEQQQDPRAWTVDQVINHITAVDGSLSNKVAHSFRQQEIDGEAFLLLDYNLMMRHMEMKLGPALKICNIISMLKSKYML